MHRYYNGLVGSATYTSSAKAAGNIIAQTKCIAENRMYRTHITRVGVSASQMTADEIAERELAVESHKQSRPYPSIKAYRATDRWCEAVYYEITAQLGYHYA